LFEVVLFVRYFWHQFESLQTYYALSKQLK